LGRVRTGDAKAELPGHFLGPVVLAPADGDANQQAARVVAGLLTGFKK